MMAADLYIGAGGTITWERFAAGLPGIVYSIAQNQVRMAEDLKNHGYQHYAGSAENYNWQKLESVIQELSSISKRWKLSQNIRDLVDGCGVERILKAWDLHPNQST
jgi:spore coat polysaccharide biosynthesis predicted glycosyltransferase SpsG